MVLTSESLINQLTIGSKFKIDVKCDYCDIEYKLIYRDHLKSTSFLNKHACKDCRKFKTKEINLLKYGVENTFQLDIFKEKIKKTNIEKYGVRHPMLLQETKDKIKNTCLEKWGVEFASQSEDFKKKVKTTNLERFGFDNPMKCDLIKDKLKKNNFDKFGVENLMSLDSTKEKIKSNCLIKYGVEYVSQTNGFKESVKQTNLNKYLGTGFGSKIILEKIKETKFEKYQDENYNNPEKAKITSFINWGVDNFKKNEDYRRQNFSISKDKFYIKYLDRSESLFNCDCGKDHQFKIFTDNYFHRKKTNLPLCTVCNPIGDSVSIKEKELYEFIISIYSGEIIQSYRDGLEIDIYLPDMNIGFEFNGLYWHSEIYKDKNYHLNKTNYFKEKGIRIIHIWEDDWTFKKEIIKSQIRNALGVTKSKIFARKCEIKLINDIMLIKNFLNSNHIQGYVKSKIKIGLFYDNELVSLMTFDQFEGRNKMSDNQWNLNRFCNKIECSVIGGASKLLKYFIENYKPTRIISYADKDWSIGNLYNNLGFTVLYETYPDYKYIIGGKRTHKSRFRKSYTGISESIIDEIKIFNCGKIKFEQTYF